MSQNYRVIADVDLSQYFIGGKVWLFNLLKSLKKDVYEDDERLIFRLEQSDIFEYDEEKGEIETALDRFIAEIDIPTYFIIKRFSNIKNIPQHKDTKCIHPWTHFYSDPVGTILPCCIASGDFGNISEFTSIDQALNSEAFKKLRLSMLNNKQPKACSVCYEQEKNNIVSWRQKRAMEQDYSYIYEQSNADGSIDNIKLKNMNLGLGNTCNLKCRICYNALSSRIEQEDIALGNISKPLAKNYDSSNFQIMFEDIKNKSLDLESIHFFGGEPLLLNMHYELLDNLIANNKTELLLLYHTNLHSLTFKDKNIIDYWSKFPKLSIAISIDASHDRGKYIRHGMNWNNVIKNIKTVKQKLPHAQIRLATTVSIYNALHVTELHKELLELGLFSCSDIEVHDALGELNESRMLPQELKAIAVDNIKQFITYIKQYPNFEHLEKNYIEIINHINSEDKSYLLPAFLDTVEELDRYRKEDFFLVFPELKLLKQFKKQ